MNFIAEGDFLDQVRTRFKRGSRLEHYRKVFDSASGRIVLHDLVREGGVMKTQGGISNEALQFAEGKRYMALYILEFLRLRPPALQQLADREVIDE